jgi:hypothetical protein
MKKPTATQGLYLTFASLCAVTLALVLLLARSSAGLQPIRGISPFSLDEPPPSQLPDAGSIRTFP